MADVMIPNWPKPTIVMRLKPCSCGSRNVSAQGGGCVWIECSDCGETGPENGPYPSSVRRAAEDWNTKKHTPPPTRRSRTKSRGR